MRPCRKEAPRPERGNDEGGEKKQKNKGEGVSTDVTYVYCPNSYQREIFETFEKSKGKREDRPKNISKGGVAGNRAKQGRGPNEVLLPNDITVV